MKIAFDTKRAFNNSTGLGNYARILLNDLMHYYPDNDYLLSTPGVKQKFADQLQGNFMLILPETKLDKSFHPLWRSYGLTKQLQQERVDIYHGLSNELPFNIHRSGIKTVVTIHDLIFLKHTAQYPFFDRQFYQLKTKYATKYADKIIAVSHETKNDLVKFYQVPEKKIEVIYQSVDESFIKSAIRHPQSLPDRQAGAIKYGLPDKFILNVGSFFPRKNHKTLIEAYALLRDKIEEDLVLVGSTGSLKKEIEGLIYQRNLQDRVKILSQVSNEDMPAIYRRASAFVFPSLYEGFGIPVLEALCSRVPVIASNGGCLEEAGGKDSVYIDPLNREEMANAIFKVLSNDILRNQMIEKGFAHALTITGNTSAEKVMNVYRELVKQ